MSGDKLPIVQVAEEDRWEAANLLVAAWGGRATKAKRIREGKMDEEHIVQAFARHRIAAETKAATTITELVSALEKARAWVLDEVEDPSWDAEKALVEQIDTALSNTRGDKNEQE